MQATFQQVLEAGFFQQQGFRDQCLGAAKFGVGRAHLTDQGGHQAVHDGVFRAHHRGVAHGAAHDAPQDVAAALVRRQDAVGHQE